MSPFENLKPAKAPWIYLLEYESSKVLNLERHLAQLVHDQIFICTLEGKSMQTLDALFNHFAEKLKFPLYFGSNWPSFDECLADLEWLPAQAYFLIVTDSESVLSGENDFDFCTLLKILDEVAFEWSQPVSLGEHWDRPGIPFHVVFQYQPKSLEAFSTRLKRCSTQTGNISWGVLQ